MWPPFFWGAIPTYGVLLYAMITVRHDIHVAECALHSKKATDAVLLYLAPVL